MWGVRFTVEEYWALTWLDGVCFGSMQVLRWLACEVVFENLVKICEPWTSSQNMYSCVPCFGSPIEVLCEFIYE